ncbi:uncharacterized protein E0L32_011700 [Thyridium curvatum]|uniref:Myb-like domain-containing protein n=1 Tax=Thyridium curvatum TaxID=1093900 RepID=A0A507BFZ4_9PEZI|nr:uncharacterized protein E0L32_011685 [Thyridium curvatum]XP_031000124.1 uncharacterized protein E0L32_011700 [Thyridium curvatum]TPX18398.1 hypothetical protein E0L32_011685 [Thyridium curvatum]TPX18413.1 hypothetical protein E0L32_011700 [Thyridium curvatum]
MSPTMHMTAPSAYTPTSDLMDRHEYGVSKNRKTASTGGGRAWSEDEEVYLLQTRLQKMPYKHIAAHLKKTELACRLHYHQLSHGSNRRKRTTSVSSGSSTSGLSPTLAASVPSPIHEDSCSPSPPGSAGSYGPTSAAVQLPSIVPGGTTGASPRLPAILPKPTSMTLALASISPSATRGSFPTPLCDVMTPHSAPLLPSASFVPTPTTATTPIPPHSATTPNLRLDCSTVPPPLPSAHGAVDMSRLQAIYAAHRTSFWTSVAAEYGAGASATILEQAWKSGVCCGAHQQTATPITPGGSPDDRDAFYSGLKSAGQQDKTRISAILGIDANPRSPKEREMVKRMEEERVPL